jgi:hypothetical protein
MVGGNGDSSAMRSSSGVLDTALRPFKLQKLERHYKQFQPHIDKMQDE